MNVPVHPSKVFYSSFGQKDVNYSRRKNINLLYAFNTSYEAFQNILTTTFDKITPMLLIYITKLSNVLSERLAILLYNMYCEKIFYPF